MKNVIGGKDIIQLKNNYIPKGLIPLEKMFDQNDVAKDPKVQPIEIILKTKTQELKIHPEL